MANYEYLIAGLPDISPDWKGAYSRTAFLAPEFLL